MASAIVGSLLIVLGTLSALVLMAGAVLKMTRGGDVIAQDTPAGDSSSQGPIITEIRLLVEAVTKMFAEISKLPVRGILFIFAIGFIGGGAYILGAKPF